MKEAVKMVGIAEELGLSQTTVSLCLSGKAEAYRIRPETVRRVQEYADEVGFVPNASARNLVMRKNSKDKVALLMVQETGSEKSVHALNQAKRLLDESGRDYLLQDCFHKTFVETVRSLKGEGVKEVVLFGPFYHTEERGGWSRYNPDPLRILFENINIYAVDDTFLGDSPVAEQIYRLGVDRVGMYFDLFGEVEKRTEGPVLCYVSPPGSKEWFMEVFASRGVALDPAQILDANSGIENPFERGRALAGPVCALLGRLPVKYAQVNDDRIATGLIAGLEEAGVHVPRDISIIGFDNIDACPYFKVPLTSVAVPIEKHIGIVFSKILDGKEIPRVVKSKAEIIWRTSAERF